MAKKQKEELRNSLEAYLETKMVQFDKNQGLKGNSNKNEVVSEQKEPQK